MNIRTLPEFAVALGIADAVYVKLIRPWYLKWGASEVEIARPMALDDRIPHPALNTTRAITIQTRPEQIWPRIAHLQGLQIENDAQRGSQTG